MACASACPSVTLAVSASRHRRSHVLPRRQAGVAAIFAAIALVTMMAALALTIDVGRLYTAQRQLQSAADHAALDSVRAVSGCNGSGARGRLSDAQSEATASLARNQSNAALQVETGMRNSTDPLSAFTPLADGDPQTSAVRITLRQPAPTRLIPGIIGVYGSTLVASAAAEQRPQASVSVGSSALNLDTATSPLLNSLLSGLLGGAVDLSVAGQQGLVAAQVSLAGLMAAAGVADAQGLLDLNLTLPGALNLVAQALNQTGGAVNATAAGTIAALVPVADALRQVRLGDVMQLPSGVPDVTTSQLPLIDALSLVTSLAEAASVGKPLALPLSVSLPAGIANVQLALTVTRAPYLAVGPAGFGPNGLPLTQARSAAITLQLRAQVLDVSGALSALSPVVGVVSQPIRLGLDVDIAPAEATVASIECPTLAAPNTRVRLDVNAQLAAVRAGTFSGAVSTLPALSSGALINAINLPLLGPVLAVNLQQPVSLGVGSSSGSSEYFVNDFPLYVTLPSPTNPRTVGDSQPLGSVGATLSAMLAQQVQVKLLGAPLPLGQVSGLLNTLLLPLLGTLDQVVDPLLGQLGIQAGSADVMLTQVSVPQARLFNIAPP
jgi:uncharacterized membrane protein